MFEYEEAISFFKKAYLMHKKEDYLDNMMCAAIINDNEEIISKIKEEFAVEDDTIEKYKKVKCPVFIVVNKIETTNFEKMYPILDKLNKYDFVKKFITTSAIRGMNIAELEKDLLECLPEGDAYYPRDEYTDKSVRFMCQEIIREKALLFLQEEIPHGIAIEIMTFIDDDKCVKIDANIVTESARHKQIIIGSNGSMLKQIGTAARKDIEELTGTKVMIELFVKVKKDWKDDVIALNEFGFNKKDI